jgi:hypothetical protein
MSLIYSPKIVTDGLVLCLDAGNSKSYPGTGTSWFDLSGNNYNGVLQNGVSYEGSNGGSLYFDGTDDYISIGNIGSPQNFSCCFWVNVTELNKGAGNDYRRVLVSSVSSNVILIEEAGQISFRVPGVSSTNFTGGLVALNNWAHICCTYNQSDRTIYQNAEFKNSQTIGAGTVNFGTIQITDVSIQSFKGYISAFRIYNKSLSAQEIKQNFNATKSRFGL